MPSFFEQLSNFAVSQEAQLLWIVQCGILSFCRVYISDSPSLFEESILRASISSSYFRESSFSILGLSLTYLSDLMLDLMYNFMSGDRLMRRGNTTDRKHDDAIMTGGEKIVFLLGIVVVPLVAFVPRDHKHLALLYICAANAQFAMLSGFVAALCARYYSKYFPKSFVNIAGICFTLTMVLTPFYANETRDNPKNNYALLYIKWVIAALFLLRVVYWFYCEYFLRLLVPRFQQLYAICCFRRTPEKDDEKKGEIDWKKRHEENTAYFPCMYVFCAVICLSFLGAMNTKSPDYYDLTDKDLFYINLPLIVFQICIFVVSSQLSKHAIVAYLHALLESKKSYVRYGVWGMGYGCISWTGNINLSYISPPSPSLHSFLTHNHLQPPTTTHRYISHELRTPLNTACLGLSLMLSEVGRLATGDDEEDAERFETLTDINAACVAAVDILNDLLSFEVRWWGRLRYGPLCCTALHCAVLCCAVLCCSALHGAAQHCAALSNTFVRHSTLLHRVASHRTPI